MKIGQNLRPVLDSKYRDNLSAKSGQAFGEAIASLQEEYRSEQLGSLLDAVEKQGQRLVQSQTIKEFYQYKQLVQQFVKEAVDYGLKLKQESTWNHHGRQQTTRLVQEVDSKLLELTDIILKKEEKSIGLLDKIGEVQGLLINIYT